MGGKNSIGWLKITGNLMYLVAALLLLYIIGLSAFYLGHSHTWLVHWYLDMGNCLYKSDEWQQKFFNPGTRSAGGTLATAGIAIAVLLLGYLTISWKAFLRRPRQTVSAATSLLWYAAVTAFCVAAGIYSWVQAAPATDEVFSAVNCAALHPLQTVSYYMLPNNHLYFNLVNNLLFGWYWPDLVQTGRLISLIAYTGTMLIAFRWLVGMLGKNWLAFIALLPIALQFTIWAMAAQARAYECFLMCGWGAFYSLYSYANGNNGRYLRINTLCNIAGFALLQTWLHIYVAECIIMALIMLRQRRIMLHPLVHILLTAGVVYLLYLPAFCFSGIGSFTANDYVRPATDNWQDFLPRFTAVSRYFINYAFSIHSGEDDLALNYVLFALPLLLLLSKNSRNRQLGVGYVLLWTTYSVITIKLRLNPFNRNMIVHYSLSMALVVYTFYTLVQQTIAWVKKLQFQRFALWFFALANIVFAGMLAARDKREGSFFLYYYDVNLVQQHHTHDMQYLPKNATIGCSNEAFYMYYRCKLAGYKVSRCFRGTEAYYVRRKTEPLPPQARGYVKFADGFDDYEFYRR